LVLSMDAMVHEDVEYMLTKPHFSRIMKKCAKVEKVHGIYPSLTYPAHTSLMTGCYPGKHGIYNNTPFETHKDGITHWYLYHKSIRTEDLFAAAKRAGCSTAAVYWPITGCNPNIDHVINEYFFYYPDEDVPETFAGQGSDEVALQAIRENMHRYPTNRGSQGSLLTSEFDDFIMGCTCSLIRNVQPDVLLIHNCHLDTLRHRNGVFDPILKEGLDQMDKWLGEVIETMEQAGVYDDTNFVILSDHGQLDVTRRIKINALLRQRGFLDIAPNGTLYDWQAYAQYNGMSASIYLRDPHNEALRAKVYDYLLQLEKEGTWGISKIYTVEEVRERYGTYGPFSFMVETDGSSSFTEEWTEPVIDHPFAKAMHGYAPEKGPQPIFLGHGPSFLEGATLHTAKLVDVAPTLARILGQKMPQAQGRCMEELLKT